ncbi:MAG: type transport system ATP-binding protein [Actinomycetota bacterium]|nr:type transport system ATP-binding protein [Actinomycetota bacterium]
MAAIEATGLTKVYRGRRGPIRALDGLDLDVPNGGVFGFLGANGAGKTTTIRAAVGHLRASRGTMRVLGATVPNELPKVIDRIGALVEQPSFFPGFSGRRNLELLARSRQISLARVKDALITVGLEERAESRFATYSLGMKQRLGVAAVLLKDPELLILDEPANGLDPQGILEMRTLLRQLAGQGRTVFVSSHILSEIQQTCDRVAIVAHGRTVAAGTVSELLQGTVSRYRVAVPGAAAEHATAANALAAAGFRGSNDERGRLVVEVTAERAHEVTRALSAASIYLSELSPIERTLEEAFLALTHEDGKTS